ncbi:MAG: hypothetical protein JWQ50_3682 [Caballeronia mineralivorans]|jgi:hypothetical protein|nr:hypothetical protein [Caballeronia mineralivorans]
MALVAQRSQPRRLHRPRLIAVFAAGKGTQSILGSCAVQQGAFAAARAARLELNARHERLHLRFEEALFWRLGLLVV